MRSWLFVPADSETKISKALAGRADVVILDLEDSVTQENKPAARAIAADTLKNRNHSSPLIYIRVNALDTGLTRLDLDAVMPAGPDGIMQPKTNDGGDVEELTRLAQEHIPVIAIATETAASVFNLGTYNDLDANLTALTWGAEDLSSELGASTSRTETGELTDPYRLVRSLCLAGACAARVQPVDTVYVDFRNEAGLQQECENAARDGFTGKMAIHPSQIETINRCFTPTQQQITHARSIIDGFTSNPDKGVIAIGGKMYDRPHLKRAEKLLSRVKLFM